MVLCSPGRILGSALCHLGVTTARCLSIDGHRAAEGVIASVAGLLGFKGLRRANRHEKAGSALYGAAVAAARAPWFYRALGVPDTLDGRFDLIALHAFLLIHRLQDPPEPGPALAQAVFDAMFTDMDNNLREIGVSDLSVGKRMRAMWEAFHGRAKVYSDGHPGGRSRGAGGGTGAQRLARRARRPGRPPHWPGSCGAGGASCRAVACGAGNRGRRSSCQRRRRCDDPGTAPAGRGRACRACRAGHDGGSQPRGMRRAGANGWACPRCSR